jgi:hypothetical protein
MYFNSKLRCCLLQQPGHEFYLFAIVSEFHMFYCSFLLCYAWMFIIHHTTRNNLIRVRIIT